MSWAGRNLRDGGRGPSPAALQVYETAADRAARSPLGTAIREADEMASWVQVSKLTPTERVAADGADGVGPAECHPVDRGAVADLIRPALR